MRPPRFLFAAAASLVLAGCASAPRESAVRFTTFDADVAGCERLGEISVPNPYGGSFGLQRVVAQEELVGTQSLDRERPELALDGRMADSLRHWAARRGADTVLVTSVRSSSARGIACRCSPY